MWVSKEPSAPGMAINVSLSKMKCERCVDGGMCMPLSMRMASHGQASTQKPQKMQRSSSITNTFGKRS